MKHFSYFTVLSFVVLCGCAPLVRAPSRAALRASAESRDAAARAELDRLGVRLQPGRSGMAIFLHHLDTPTTDRALAAAAALMDLSSITLNESRPTEGWVMRLGGAPHLRHIVMFGVPLAAQDIAAMRTLPRLESLNLIDTGATDGTLAYLAERGPRLTELTIAREPVTDDGAIWLAGIPSLRTLRLVNTRVSGRRIAYLLVENPRLTVELGEEGDEVKGGWVLR